jgi:pilus assembly protein Flp/PilA
MSYLTDLMKSAYAWLKVDSEKGVAAIEYALLAALIAVGIVTAAVAVGTNISTVFTTVNTHLSTGK